MPYPEKTRPSPRLTIFDRSATSPDGLRDSQIAPGGAYSTRPVPPFAVPRILNQMFWGGLWGAVFAAIADKLPRQWPLIVTGFLFGVIGPVLVGWFIVAPIKGNPIAGGWAPQRMLASVLINGAFGIGVAYIFTWLRAWVAGRSAASA